MVHTPFSRAPALAPGREELEVGYIQGAFGVRGEVKLFLHNHESDLFDSARDVVLVDPKGGRWAAKLGSRSGAGKRILGQLVGLTDRDVANALRDWRILVDTATLPELDDDEFYMWQLEGAEVRVDGVRRGTLTSVQTTDGGDIFVIDAEGTEVFVPCVKAWVVSIDAQAGVVELAPGALEDV